jgi:hypothetical protein
MLRALLVAIPLTVEEKDAMKRSFVYTLTPDVPQTLHVKATDDQNATLVASLCRKREGCS